MKFISPFAKWDKDKIIELIKQNGFTFESEYCGIFQFHKVGANNKDKFYLNYILYLGQTMLYICNPNLKISPSIKSHKSLDQYLRQLIKIE